MRRFMAFRLRYLAHDLEVPVGRFVIGRHAECQISLDDPMVSRRHALLVVEPDGTVFLEDLGARNGVIVNGDRVQGTTRLAVGDVVQIGGQRLTLGDDRAGAPRREARSKALGSSPPGPRDDASPPPSADSRPKRRVSGQYEMDAPTMARGPIEPSARPDRRVSSLSLLGGVADKALSLGRAEQAARVLYRPLIEVLSQAREGAVDEPGLAEAAAVYATRLARATGRGEWVDFVFEL